MKIIYWIVIIAFLARVIFWLIGKWADHLDKELLKQGLGPLKAVKIIINNTPVRKFDYKIHNEVDLLKAKVTLNEYCIELV